MKPGDSVIHAASGKQLTVKDIGGNNGMVLCAWMEPKRGSTTGEMIECRAAFDWRELRAATVQAEEKKQYILDECRHGRAGVPCPECHDEAVEGSGLRDESIHAQADEAIVPHPAERPRKGSR